MTAHQLALNRAAKRRWYERDPERAKRISREASRRHREHSPAKVEAALVKYRASAKGKRRVAVRSREFKYGITGAQFDALIIASGGRCALCQRIAPNDDRQGLVVDHSHRTGKVRSLICGPCNRALGYTETYGLTEAWLARALAYLRAHE